MDSISQVSDDRFMRFFVGVALIVIVDLILYKQKSTNDRPALTYE